MVKSAGTPIDVIQDLSVAPSASYVVVATRVVKVLRILPASGSKVATTTGEVVSTTVAPFNVDGVETSEADWAF